MHCLLLQIGRKIPLIGSAALNFVLLMMAAFLLQFFGSNNDIVNYIVVAMLCIFVFSISFSWS